MPGPGEVHTSGYGQSRSGGPGAHWMLSKRYRLTRSGSTLAVSYQVQALLSDFVAR